MGYDVLDGNSHNQLPKEPVPGSAGECMGTPTVAEFLDCNELPLGSSRQLHSMVAWLGDHLFASFSFCLISSYFYSSGDWGKEAHANHLTRRDTASVSVDPSVTAERSEGQVVMNSLTGEGKGQKDKEYISLHEAAT